MIFPQKTATSSMVLFTINRSSVRLIVSTSGSSGIVSHPVLFNLRQTSFFHKSVPLLMARPALRSFPSPGEQSALMSLFPTQELLKSIRHALALTYGLRDSLLLTADANQSSPV